MMKFMLMLTILVGIPTLILLALQIFGMLLEWDYRAYIPFYALLVITIFLLYRDGKRG